MMKCWLEEWLDFLFPAPVEVDIGGEPVEDEKLGDSASISDSGGADPLKSVSGKQASAPPDALPEIPEMYRAEPAVREAERVVRSRR